MSWALISIPKKLAPKIVASACHVIWPVGDPFTESIPGLRTRRMTSLSSVFCGNLSIYQMADVVQPVKY